ncbi:tyrosine-type recombinase/integrase [Legionella yabuuchiae]|uniref:tyrosine-type recombinase/integrase n=1 Tax=Legionella yabuuchiae TaxID=376727 RepID=UPI0010547188|nr:site-specific integrase [Legionella yabuuchiae]
MALKKRNGVWWVDITHDGERIRRSTKTEVKAEAQLYHDKLKSELWEASRVLKIPKKGWKQAAIRWIDESGHKRSLIDDKTHLRWVEPFFKDLFLTDITTDILDDIAKKKEATGVSPASVNRMLEVIRAILRRAHKEWGWLDVVPAVRMRKEENRRIRWITYQEASRLLNELPEHLKDMAAFSLATGLRQSNVTGLKWCDVNLIRNHALVNPEDSKTSKAIPVPLNQDAVDILIKQKGKHPVFVFAYKGNPVSRCNNHAWRKALNRAGIKNFRWHDLRHTWASWHVQNGTSLPELQQLGGWSSFEMVLRYAHLSSDHLKQAANRIQSIYRQPKREMNNCGAL